jgi:hypothetical protein
MVCTDVAARGLDIRKFFLLLLSSFFFPSLRDFFISSLD